MNHYYDSPPDDAKEPTNGVQRTVSFATRNEYILPSKAPEDEGFDHHLVAAKQPGLVRGASLTSRQTASSTSMYSQSSPIRPSPIDEEPHDPYDDKYGGHHADASDAPLVSNAAEMGGRSSKYQDLEYADPYDASRAKPVSEKANPLTKLLTPGDYGKYPLEQRIQDKKRGIGRQRYPFVVWTLTLVMCGVFIYELVSNSHAQGTPVSFKPVVNYMLGPASAVLINVGARFPPCMKLVEAIPPTMQMACMNATSNPPSPDTLCTVEEVCGFGGFHDGNPNQWFRFIVPIFLHAGFIHLLLNMLAQLTITAQIEREMGSGGFVITYFAAGIFGNVLGGNFTLVGVPSVGASGAIFGTVAVTWVDLFAHWKLQYRPVRKLIFMTIELLIGVAIGYIPYVDNFAHLGGFLMGLLVGTVFYPVISTSKRHHTITWGFRLVAIPLAIILFVVLIRNFYTSDPYAACSGCRYLSCFPTDANDHCQGTGLTNSTSN
ncbi:rhomboid-domain-containing protein [Dendrothele bispora CBS 962.96]|uniref:Rhomboid-type serine protease n=1 Tax=Dendrothele bispora (strain CBS 962.96) TaxID=1314807 RepID=A0A4S8MWJ3_DENBC|nr:rhomboid-domain-containing protein [Dendrothele bispora CBS 962.96]